MLISGREMFLIQKRTKQVLSSLLVILLALSSIVTAKQTQSRTSPSDQKQTTLKTGDKQSSPDLPREADYKQDPKLAVYQVHRLADKILTLRSVRAKAFEIARLASVFQAIAKTQVKGPSPNLTEETVDKALKATRSMSDGRRPFLLLTAAAQLANLKSPAVHSALAEAVRDFNSFEDSALARLDWAQSIQIGPMNARFPLDVANIDFSFNEAFRAVAFADPDAAMARAEELRNENLRAQGLVEVGTAFLEKLPKESEQNEQAIRVGEDGMRKSASKTVMPSYPEEALKKRQQAPSQSIGDAVGVALKQWKFVPAKKG